MTQIAILFCLFFCSIHGATTSGLCVAIWSTPPLLYKSQFLLNISKTGIFLYITGNISPLNNICFNEAIRLAANNTNTFISAHVTYIGSYPLKVLAHFSTSGSQEGPTGAGGAVDVQFPQRSIPSRGEHNLETRVLVDWKLSWIFLLIQKATVKQHEQQKEQLPSLRVGHTAGNRTAPAAELCTSRLLSHGGASSSSTSFSASFEDADCSEVLSRNALVSYCTSLADWLVLGAGRHSIWFCWLVCKTCDVRASWRKSNRQQSKKKQRPPHYSSVGLNCPRYLFQLWLAVILPDAITSSTVEEISSADFPGQTNKLQSRGHGQSSHFSPTFLLYHR